MSTASTGRWAWSVMFQYLVVGRRYLNFGGPICLALDGAKVAGEETMHTLALSPVTKKCIWLPAQVDFLGKKSVCLPTTSRADFLAAFLREEIGAGVHAQIRRNRDFFAKKIGFLREAFSHKSRFLSLEFCVWV